MNTWRVLVIEDEVLVGMDVVAILTAAGFGNVQHAMTEAEALQLIADHHWDAVVADANLNGRSIEQVVTALQSRQVPFVITTGYERKSLPEMIGGAPLLSKPVPERLLVQTLKELCSTGSDAS